MVASPVFGSSALPLVSVAGGAGVGSSFCPGLFGVGSGVVPGTFGVGVGLFGAGFGAGFGSGVGVVC